MKYIIITIFILMPMLTKAQVIYIYDRYYKIYSVGKKDTVYFLSNPKKVYADAKTQATLFGMKNWRYKFHARVPKYRPL
jgi:hypothetical protein